VPAAQSAAFVDAVRRAGGDVEVHVYPGEGHGWRSAATVGDAFARTTEFLDRKVLT
jgi:dipeptidyl aminopeptidase/acylaminoacyl peptidase